MSRTLFALAGCAVLLLLAGCGGDRGEKQGAAAPVLPACGSGDTLFDDIALEDWPATYYQLVDSVVEAHWESIKNIGQQPLSCLSPDSALPPTTELKSLAGRLPPWQREPSLLKNLSETDMGTVLLEFLREYECVLHEQEDMLPVRYFIFDDEFGELSKMIEGELRLSRPGLERTLRTLSGFDRLQPLLAEIECLKRASLDLRNVLGLAAEAGSCLPKIEDGHTSIRLSPP